MLSNYFLVLHARCFVVGHENDTTQISVFSNKQLDITPITPALVRFVRRKYDHLRGAFHDGDLHEKTKKAISHERFRSHRDRIRATNPTALARVTNCAVFLCWNENRVPMARPVRGQGVPLLEGNQVRAHAQCQVW